MQKPKLEGGLALPNFLHYYWAANIHFTLFWFQPFHFGLCDLAPAWVDIEEGSCSAALLCILLTTILRCPFGNCIVWHSLRAWSQLQNHFGLQRLPLVLLTITPHFPHHLMIKPFIFGRERESPLSVIFMSIIFFPAFHN